MSETPPYPPPPDHPPEPEQPADPERAPEAAPAEPAQVAAAPASPEPAAIPEEPRPAAPPLPAPPPPYYPAHPAPPPPYPAYAAPPPPYPAYGPAPQPYPPYQAPQADHPSQASYPPAQYGAPPQFAYAPPYGYAPSQRRLGRLGRNAWLAITAGIVVAAILLGVIAYGIAGYVVSQNEISNGSNAIGALSSHRASIISSFDSISQQVISLDPQGSGGPGKTAATQIVTASQGMGNAVSGSTQSLHTAQVKLNDLSWLTAFSRGSLQDESARLDHARKAVADVQAASNDYAQLGRFLQSYYQALVDLDNLNAASDATAFVNAFTALRSDLATALQLAIGVPGLPTQFHDFLSALQAQANDFRQESLAAASGDQAGVDAAKKALAADTQKADAIDFSGTTAAIHSYYQRIRDDFTSEMDQATA